MCIEKVSTSPRTCYAAAKMTIFLFLLFIQMSCGGGGGTAPLAVATSSAVTPVGKAAVVDTDAAISVSFASDLDPATVNANNFKVVGPEGAISGTVSYDASTRSATFTPYASLMPEASYTATLTTGISNSSGSPMSANYSWEVQTGKDLLARSANEAVPATMFGLHMHYADTTTIWPTTPFGTWRLWDAYVAWPWLEPTKGSWRFEKLDRYISLAEANNVEVLLPLAFTPTWASARPQETIPYGVAGSPAEPASIEDWKNYVRTVATRYKGRIHYYEIWNEPNLAQFYTGTVPEMIKLVAAAHLIIKEVDPSAMVISPSATGNNNGVDWLEQFLSQGGANVIDIIGYHFYVTPNAPETMVELVSKVKRAMSTNNVAAKPLWNTETGWSIANNLTTVTATGTFSKILSDTEASAYVARSFILSWASGVERLYWYGWDNKQMGLVEADGKTIKTSATAYSQIFSWLNGGKVVSCGKNNLGIWIAQINRADSTQNWAVWTTEGTKVINIPMEWNAKQSRDLSGNLADISSATTISVGISPTLIVGGSK